MGYFSMSSLGPDTNPNPPETLELTFDPIKTGSIFCTVTDIHGVRWSLQGQIGDKVFACREYETGSFNSTCSDAMDQGYNVTWRAHPYRVVEESSK